MILRIKLLKNIYGSKFINYLLIKLDKFLVDLIGSYICKGYTLDYISYQVIHNTNITDYNSKYFCIKVASILDKFYYMTNTIDQLNHCEYIFRFINIYYNKLLNVDVNGNLSFVIVTKNKILQLQQDCINILHNDSYIISHNVNTRLNKKKLKNIISLRKHMDSFTRECNECLHLLNNIIILHNGNNWH